MILSARFLFLGALVAFAGCHTAGKVAVSSFRVIDTPARMIRDRIDPPESTTTTTTTTSDVSNPGGPVQTAPLPSPTPHRQVAASRSRSGATPTATPRPRTESTVTTTQRKPTPSATPRIAASQAPQFPTARPVPGKPGFVYSIDPKGGIVDVTGYKSGDKAKDPYTQQVFIIP